jgi:hypothetical protein
MFLGRLTGMLDIDEHSSSVWSPGHARDFASDGSRQESPDLAGHWISGEHLVIADVFPIRLRHVLGGGIRLNPKHPAPIEGQAIRLSKGEALVAIPSLCGVGIFWIAA